LLSQVVVEAVDTILEVVVARVDYLLLHLKYYLTKLVTLAQSVRVALAVERVAEI
jgi:hypothetical protein